MMSPRQDLHKDTFCIYCQQEFELHEKLVDHIAKEHKQTYAYNAYVLGNRNTAEKRKSR